MQAVPGTTTSRSVTFPADRVPGTVKFPESSMESAVHVVPSQVYGRAPRPFVGVRTIRVTPELVAPQVGRSAKVATGSPQYIEASCCQVPPVQFTSFPEASFDMAPALVQAEPTTCVALKTIGVFIWFNWGCPGTLSRYRVLDCAVFPSYQRDCTDRKSVV